MPIEPWTVEATREVVRDRWIDLRADDCRTPGGVAVAPYYVLHQPDWVGVLPVTLEGDLVMVEEYHHGIGRVETGFVGGGIGPGEAPVDAAARELREETGYEARTLVDLGWVWANWGNQDNRVHLFWAEGCRRVAGTSNDAGEETAVVLRPVGAVLNDPPRQGFTVAALWLARDRLAEAAADARA